MKVLMRNLVIIFMLVWQSVCFAKVKIGDDAGSAAEKKASVKKKLSQPIKKHVQQVEIEGYADSRYVRFVVDIVNSTTVAGQMHGTNGPKSNVHGEIVDGVIHLYEPNGQHYTVIIAK